MKKLTLLLATILTAFTVISSQADDEKMAHLLIGKWRGISTAPIFTGQRTETVRTVYDGN